jgi:ATP-dependent exoDNAse (exonuclease V) beta subunit
MQIIDQTARTTALDPRGSFIVQAPAGSGKTELLTQRILSLLATTQQPEEVLAITFTRKAAEEMRLRVMQALQTGLQTQAPEQTHAQQTWRLAQAVLQQDEKYDWGLLQNPQRLQIMTIDAFCGNLARQMPVVSRMGAIPKVTQQPWVLYQQAAQNTIQDLLAQDDEDMQNLLLHLDNQQARAAEEIAKMLQYREQWLGLLLHQQRNDLREFLQDNIAQIVMACLQRAAAHFPVELWHELQKLLRFAVQHLNSPELEALLHTDSLDNDITTLPKWRALTQWLFTQTGTVKKSPDKRMGFPAGKNDTLKLMKSEMKAWLQRLEEHQALVACLQQIRMLPDTEYHEQQWQVLKALFAILPTASAQLLLQFQQQGCVDFSAIAQSALHALGEQDDPTDLTLKLDNKINHILVDEFQDTSFLQFELLEKLVAGWQAGDGRTLFLVGDPMQSIYRFRQAQVGLFLRAQEQGIAGVRLSSLSLQMNFRSSGEFIHWLNQHAPQCFAEEDDSTLGAITYAPSASIHEQKDTQCVYAYTTEDAQQQAEQVVQTLQQLQNDETIESIAVLVRARSHLSEITEVLAQYNLPYQAIELEPLLAQPVVQHLLALTRSYNNLGDALAWLAVLHGPLCGLSLQDISLMRCQHTDKTIYENLQQIPSAISAQGKQILQRVTPLLQHSILNKQRLSLAHSIKSLWLSLGGPAHAQGEQALRDAQAFFDLLDTCEQGGSINDESAFLQALQFTFSKPRSQNTKIQVMTIHRAKGLEFDAVLIPGLERRAPANEKPLLLWDNLPTEEHEALIFAPIHATQGETEAIFEYLWDVQKQKGRFELGRLLYVALTRTRTQLHLFASLEEEKKAPDQGSLLALLWPTMQEVFLSNRLELQPATKAEKIALTCLAPDWQWPKILPPLQPQTEIDNSRGNHVSLTICAQQRLRDMAVGTVLHSALYHQDDNADAWRMHLLELGVQDRLEAAIEVIKQGYSQAQLDSRGQWILNAQQHARAEYAILARYKDQCKSIIIDKTFVDEQGTRWIIDYKTSEPGDIPLEQFYAQAQKDHAKQLECYAAILAQQEDRPIRLGLYFPLFAGWHEWEA